VRIILVDVSTFVPGLSSASILWNTPDSCGISRSLLDISPMRFLVVFRNKTNTPCICIYLVSTLFPITSCSSGSLHVFRTSGLEHQLTNHLPVTSHYAPPQAFEGHPWWPGQSALRWAGVTPCSLWLCQGVGEPLGLGERRERRPADGEQWLQSLPAVLGTRSQRLLLPSPSAKYVTQIQHCKPLPENLHDTVSRSVCFTGCGVLILKEV